MLCSVLSKTNYSQRLLSLRFDLNDNYNHILVVQGNYCQPELFGPREVQKENSVYSLQQIPELNWFQKLFLPKPQIFSIPRLMARKKPFGDTFCYGHIHYSSIINAATAGPEIYFDEEWDCRVKQIAFSAWDDDTSIPEMLVKCVHLPSKTKNYDNASNEENAVYSKIHLASQFAHNLRAQATYLDKKEEILFCSKKIKPIK